LRDQGYHVDLISKAYGEDELIERLSGYQALGIRSKTKVTERVIKSAPQVGLAARREKYWMIKL
jgi:D-3-phosphoglycerate dehydrogenase